MTGKGTNANPAKAETGHGALRDRLQISDQEFQALGRMGAMYYEQGILDKARKIFEGLVELDPDSGDAHAALGALLTRTNEFDAALEHLDRATELDAQDIAPYVNRAEIYTRQGRVEEAVANLRRAIELDPKETDPAANRARAMALGMAEAFRAHGLTGDRN